MKVAGYVRLSRDEDRENYTSIENQQMIIREYAQKFNWSVSEMYVDDNFSGYDFGRPEFARMKRDLEEGKIDVIIAKDASRIGRHNARTLLFIEKVIFDCEKRLILPKEGRKGFDSKNDDIGELMQSTYYNEKHIRDTSGKIRDVFEEKQKKGELVMGNHYGYTKNPSDKSRLVVDEAVRPAIRLIFELYLQGNGYKKICDILNEKGVPTPSQHIKNRRSEQGKLFKHAVSTRWQTHNIQRIIQNDLYIGVLRTHKKYSKRMKGKQMKVPKEEQYVFEGHHEPVIRKEDFELAQKVNSKRKKENYRGSAKYNYIFSGFAVCGDCGFAATGRNLDKGPGKVPGYECTRYAKYGLRGCVRHSIPESKALFFFKEFLSDLKEQHEECLKNLKVETRRKERKDSLRKLQKDERYANEELQMLLKQKVADLMAEGDPESRILLEDNYNELISRQNKKIKELRQNISDFERIEGVDLEDCSKSGLEVFNRILNESSPDRKLLELILDRVVIYHDGNIEFKMQINMDGLVSESPEGYPPPKY